MSSWNPNLEGIAIVGVAARLPGANSAAEFWENQKNGVESISTSAKTNWKFQTRRRW